MSDAGEDNHAVALTQRAPSRPAGPPTARTPRGHRHGSPSRRGGGGAADDDADRALTSGRSSDAAPLDFVEWGPPPSMAQRELIFDALNKIVNEGSSGAGGSGAGGAGGKGGAGGYGSSKNAAAANKGDSRGTYTFTWGAGSGTHRHSTATAQQRAARHVTRAPLVGERAQRHADAITTHEHTRQRSLLQTRHGPACTQTALRGAGSS